MLGALAGAAIGWWDAARAQSQVTSGVSLQGLMGQRAVLVIDGSVRSLVPGQSHAGVKLLQVGPSEVVVELGGRREVLRMGESQAQVGDARGGAAGVGARLIIPVGAGGHFLTDGRINGHSVRFMVDTGASLVALGAAEAERLGINYRAGQAAMVSTANGTAPAFRVRLRSLRVGDFEFSDTDALVAPQPMPYILLGNNLLSRFQMTREAERMILVRLY